MAIRLYTLYERQRGTKRWTRAQVGSYPAPAMTKQSAIRIYQNRLLESALGQCDLERKLDVVKEPKHG